MKYIKQFFKTKRTLVWFIVSIILVPIMIVVYILGTNTFAILLSTLFGGEEIIGRDKSVNYFTAEAKTKKEAKQNGDEMTEKICEEGFVLLKNNGVLPMKTPVSDSSVSERLRVSVFGKNSVNLVYGGSGSGGANTEGAPTIFDSLNAAGFDCNPQLRQFYESSASGAGRTNNPSIESGVSRLDIGETPYSSYPQDVKSSYSDYDDAAIIVLSRIGGEGWDLPRYSQTEHYLQLDANEKELIKNVTAAFSNVIVILNSNNVMEIAELEENDGISAIIHMAGPGYMGVNALGRLLNGQVTFSGHTVDTWATDFAQDPTWNSFGNNLVGSTGSGNSRTPAGNEYVDESGKASGYYFVDYYEGIYVGYRYWETRSFTENSKPGAEQDEWYSDNVIYPFGYGLSYTTFNWEIVDSSSISGKTLTDADKNTDFEIKVKVTNTGDYDGKEVVQLYATTPYYENGIEKAHVVLCGFAKTGLLEKNGGEETVTLTFNPYDIASYDYNDANGNGNMGYELDGGDYQLKLQVNAHSLKNVDSIINFSVAGEGDKGEIIYSEDPVTEKPVVNRFEDADDEIEGEVLSRMTWNIHEMVNTRPFDESYVTKKMLDSRTTNNPTEYTTVPTQGDLSSDLKLIELRGVDYDDPLWDELLNKLTFDELKNLYNNGAFRTIAIESIGKPATLESDGPVGFTNFMSDAEIYGTTAYPAEVVMGSTWNAELVQEMGECVGEEGILGKISARSQTPYSGWYAPGINIHRSPFGGRNYEYFSEDSFLSGKLAAAEISGANSKGLYTFMKHFALNEQETNRDDNGICTWATEQAIREIYLKPFEMAVKEGNAHGIMTSFNRIGTRWTGGDYRLVTEVLEDEWGFVGAVICDFNVPSYMNGKQMAYAGGDINLTTTRPWLSAKADNAGDVTVLREAAHDTLYTIVNSCAMNGIDKNTVLRIAAPLYQTIIIIVECIIGAGLIVWGVLVILKTFVFKKNKEKSPAINNRN